MNKTKYYCISGKKINTTQEMKCSEIRDVFDLSSTYHGVVAQIGIPTEQPARSTLLNAVTTQRSREMLGTQTIMF